MKEKKRKINFSDKEIEILKLVAIGYTDQEIGNNKDISIHTVRHYINELLKKSGTVNRVHLVYWATREKII